MNQNHTEFRPCPVCGNRSGNALARLTYALFDDLNIPGTKTMICCDACAMIYDDVAFTQDQLQEYYRRNEHYASFSAGGGGGVCDDNNERYDRMIDTMKPNTDDLIVDYGGGQGGFIARCRHHGLRAVGIEPSGKSRDVAQKSGLLMYESINEFFASTTDLKINALVFSHVMEHILNPMQLIRLFAPYAEDTSVYMEVPDADSYLSPKEVRWPEMYFEHLSHFRRHNLAEFANNSGIEIFKEETVPFSRKLGDTKCLVLVGRFSGQIEKQAAKKKADYHRTPALPALPFLSACDTPQDGHPLALWGVSQYAMLLLGSCPAFARRVSRLFDASPAKIGRRINGIAIESADELNALPDNVNLLIPRSNFLTQMLDQLRDAGFKRAVWVI